MSIPTVRASTGSAPYAVEASALPVDTRRPPARPISGTDGPVGHASTLTGTPTASTTALICSAVVSPGA